MQFKKEGRMKGWEGCWRVLFPVSPLEVHYEIESQVIGLEHRQKSS